MLRWISGFLLVGVVAMASSSGTPVAAAGDCSADQPGVTGTIQIPTHLTVGHRITVMPLIQDSRPYVDGSLRVTIAGPGGSYTYNPDTGKGLVPSLVGHYTASAEAKVVACEDPETGETRYATDTAGPVGFNVEAPLKPHATFKAYVKRLHGGGAHGPGIATLIGFMQCPDSQRDSADPISVAVYFARGGYAPSQSSRHVMVTEPRGCQAPGGAHPVPAAEKKGRRFDISVDPGRATVEVTGPRTKMRVLIEMRSAGKVVGATRGHFKKAPHGGETVVPDGAACPDAPRGCAKWPTLST
ncbi:MAG: hypothetical protein QOG63_1907 [Thermoleophilaceae bacterium]|nr:hypothetical protein [Thermoleophilaceae bacterium]